MGTGCCRAMLLMPENYFLNLAKPGNKLIFFAKPELNGGGGVGGGELQRVNPKTQK